MSASVNKLLDEGETMNRVFSNRKIARIALALTTAVALTLPVNMNAATTLASNPTVRYEEMEMSAAMQPSRLDGVAAALMARPAALLTSRERRELADRYSDQVTPPNTDLEAFAKTSEFAAVLAAGSVDEFVMTLSYLTLDATDNWTAICAGPLTRLRNRVHNALPFVGNSEALFRYGSEGFAFDDKSNQPQHFWYSVAITYKYGGSVALAIARYHEWNPPALLRWLPGTGNGRGADGDLRLSRLGITLGAMLRDGAIRPEGVGEWMRTELRGEPHRDGSAWKSGLG